MIFNKDSWKEIFDTIKKNKLRTFLSGFTVALGILIFSSGLCIFGEAIIRKSQNLDFFLIGTLSLILINAGACIMIKTKELSI